MRKEIKYLYIEIMYIVWQKYHRYILHFGTRINFMFTCRHYNPFDILTPRRLKRQFEAAKDIEL